MFEALLEVVRDFIPSKDLPTPVWVARWVVVLLVTYAVSFPLYWGFRDTELGVRYGLRTVHQASFFDFVQSQNGFYDLLSRLSEEVPQIDGAFLFLGFNRQSKGLSYFESADSIALTQKFAPGLRSSKAIDEIWHFDQATYREQFAASSSDCVPAAISQVNRRRLSAILPGNDSDRVIVCPLINQKKVFGMVAVIFTAPKDKPASQDNEIGQTVKRYGWSITDFVRSQPAIEIRG